MTKRTALHDTHDALGASFTEFAGWDMPIRYDSETVEHNAVRTTAGLFDLSHMGEIEVSGPEAGSALDYALVGRPSRIEPGRARYTMLCAKDGGILDDLVVYRLTNNDFLVVANAGNVDVVAAELTDRSTSFGATVVNASDRWCLIAVQGPRSAAVLSDVTPLEISSLKYYGIAETTVVGHTVLVARTGYTGEDGFEIYCAPYGAVAIWNALASAGNRHDLKPAGLACRDTLRLEAGMPLYGNELNQFRTPFDAGLGRLVAFDKVGGFVGDEALSAIAASDPGQVLVGLATTGRRSPRHGYVVNDAETGRPIGRVTSGAPSPTLGYPIAMAYVEWEYSLIGTAVAIDIRGTSATAQVVALPFYKRRA